MTQPRLESRDPSLEGLRVLVVGLGRSGLAAVRLASARGAAVTVTDRRQEADVGPAAEAARALGARLSCGGHPAELIEAADLVVVSPGVPGDIDLLRAARAAGLPVWGEIELAARFCKGRVIGITGSNGKSTVTSMAGGILRAGGVPGATGGNLDTPFCDMLEEDGPGAIHSLELSSFQLETVESFRPDVAVILNLSPDHLDRYERYEDYANAKARLLQVQARDSSALLNADDPESERFHEAVRGRLYLFSTKKEVRTGAFLREGWLVLRTHHGEEALLEADALPVPGEHNRSNALAAALACRLAGCTPNAIVDGLRAYRALRHRMEPVGTIGGVTFVNDSKATNPAAAACALASFGPGRVHLILGGKDKGADWSPLVPLVQRHARQVLLVGHAAEMLETRLAGATRSVRCDTVGMAVTTAAGHAKPGDVVLLSPGCASFDQYGSFEERGDDFRLAVAGLRREETDA